jgi:SAM-dependent methyltransferase
LKEAASPARPGPGGSTASAAIVDYRLGKLQELGLLTGNWLDYGCADGGYAIGLIERGVTHVTGVDVGQERIEEAQKRYGEDRRTTFMVVDALSIPFDDASFDGVLLNEVLEHVEDESATLSEITRVLKRGGHLALFSPNRWFPIEGHGIEGASGWEFDHPTPLVPWLPDRWTARVRRARNYWPSQAVRLVRRAGLEVNLIATAFPQFEIYPWMPRSWIPRYRRLVPRLEATPLVRWLGVSVFIVARKP